jgi:tetratricopeptide (TPR) repeat protein
MRRLLLLVALCATLGAVAVPVPGDAPVLPWIEDDYPKALAQARARKVPIFAEAWAPWCHTCRSMRAFVFTDRALARDARRFVWLSIDTEKAQNAAFSSKYPIKAWPSFYVIDPKSETIALRWVGGATVAQLEKIFTQGERAVAGGRKGAAEALARADALYGEGRYADAAPAYRQAIKLLPVRSAEYARAVESLLFALSVDGKKRECADLALQALPGLRGSASAANLAGSGLDCALDVAEGEPGRAESVAALEAEARRLIADTRRLLPADDRSALYASVMDSRERAKDEEGARRNARDWVAFLDGEAARAKTPEQLTALDPNRLNAYEAAGQIERAIPMLEGSARAFPDDYNPPARLAYVYLKLKRYDEALAANDAALARVYGPRKIRVFLVRADILRESGDGPGARRALEEALAYAQSLPEGQRSDPQIAGLKKRLAAASGDSAGR